MRKHVNRATENICNRLNNLQTHYSHSEFDEELGYFYTYIHLNLESVKLYGEICNLLGVDPQVFLEETDFNAYLTIFGPAWMITSNTFIQSVHINIEPLVECVQDKGYKIYWHENKHVWYTIQRHYQ